MASPEGINDGVVGRLPGGISQITVCDRQITDHIFAAEDW